MEKNRSNGEQGATDGGDITLDGNIYNTGLGVHANSSITYHLNGQYSRFISYIGVDDEVGSAGSVIFMIFTNGNPVEVYNSGLMTGASLTKHVDIDVTGVNELKLVVNNGDTADGDHADWADAYLMQ